MPKHMHGADPSIPTITRLRALLSTTSLVTGNLRGLYVVKHQANRNFASNYNGMSSAGIYFLKNRRHTKISAVTTLPVLASSGVVHPPVGKQTVLPHNFYTQSLLSALVCVCHLHSSFTILISTYYSFCV